MTLHEVLGGWIEIARKRAKDGTSEEEIVERAQDLKNRAHTQKSNRNFGGRAHTCYTPDGGLWHQLPNGRWDHFGWV